MNGKHCPFCNQEELKPRIIKKSRHFFAIKARTELSPGHTLIVSRFHRPNLLALNSEESKQLLSFIKATVKEFLKKTESYNIFTNIGKAAGQSVDHFHLHIVPRYKNEKISPFKKLNK